MNIYLKQFLQRGIDFGGFGPIIAGIVIYCISLSVEGFTLSGGEVLLAIVSTYILAFVQAGASVFNQIEHWSLPKSLLCHLSVLYVTYTLCYLANTWIPFEPMVLLIFTLVFLAVYFAVWLTVYICIKATSKKFNAKIN